MVEISKSDVYLKFESSLSEYYGLICDGQLAVAVSGGADSLSLLLLLNEWVKNTDFNCTIIALIVDHSLRSESSSEASNVANICTKYGIKSVILKWDFDKNPTNNIQSRAREARYRLMIDYCHENNIFYLFVAHNLDDLAENFLIRLDRGSGLDGLSAINSFSIKNNLCIIRPLLHIMKKELEDFLVSLYQNWIVDPSNFNQKYTRVRMRDFLANDDLLKKRIVEASLHLSRVRECINSNLVKHMVRIVDIHPGGFASLKLNLLKEVSEEEFLRILSSVLMVIGNKEYKSRFINLQKLAKKIRYDTLIKNYNLNGCNIFIEKGQLIISKNVEDNAKIYFINHGETIIWDNRFKVSLNKCSNITLGLGYLKIFNNIDNIDKILKKQNALSVKILSSLPVFVALDKIVSIPHIGYYDSDLYRNNIFCNFYPKRNLL